MVIEDIGAVLMGVGREAFDERRLDACEIPMAGLCCGVRYEEDVAVARDG